MKLPDILPRQKFEGCEASFEEATVILFGAGFDGTTSYRPGSRFAPLAIRAETLYSQENYSPYFQMDLTEKKIHDLGDIDLPIGNKDKALQLIRETTDYLIRNGKKPFMIGGEHLVTLPAVSAILNKFPDLRILQLDAHLDLMDELFGDTLSHGTVMRRIAEQMPEKERIFQVGIRSGSREEFDFARLETRLFPFTTEKFLQEVHLIGNHPVYLSIDVDVFDPSLIPGTGTPEAGGIFFPEFIEFLKGIRHLNIVGGDLVELSPYIDPTHTSTIVTAKILREILLII